MQFSKKIIESHKSHTMRTIVYRIVYSLLYSVVCLWWDEPYDKRSLVKKFTRLYLLWNQFMWRLDGSKDYNMRHLTLFLQLSRVAFYSKTAKSFKHSLPSRWTKCSFLCMIIVLNDCRIKLLITSLASWTCSQLKI